MNLSACVCVRWRTCEMLKHMPPSGPTAASTGQSRGGGSGGGGVGGGGGGSGSGSNGGNNVSGISRGLNRSIQPLNVSTISQGSIPSKLMGNGAAPSSMRMSSMLLNTTPLTSSSSNHTYSNQNFSIKHRVGAREALTSLGLLCLG